MFGIGRERIQSPPDHKHQPEFESFSYKSQAVYDILRFEEFANTEPCVPSQGFVQFLEELIYSISLLDAGI